MKRYQLTDRETALMLEALNIAVHHAEDTTGTNPEHFRKLFATIVAQHDLQHNSKEVQ